MGKRFSILGFIVAMVLAGSVLPAAADTTVDYWAGSVNGCTIDSWGTNFSGSGGAGGTVRKQGTCASQICIQTSVNDNGTVRWISSTWQCIPGGAVIGYTADQSQGGSGVVYFGRRLRVGAVCVQDTIFTNPAPSSC